VWGGARGWNADQFGRLLLLPLVRPLFGGVGNAGGGGGLVRRHAVGSWGSGLFARVLPGWVRRTLQGLLYLVPPCPLEGVWVWRGRVGVSGRTLRTAQWTRASS